MAHISTESVAEIRKELKAKFPKFKFGVLRRNGMEVVVSLLSSPHSFADALKEHTYCQVNHYYIDQHFENEAERELLTSIYDTILTAPARTGQPYYDRSDSQSDYFDTAYYSSITIGRWDKPYTVI